MINTIFLKKSQIFPFQIITQICYAIGWNLQQTKEALDIFSDKIDGDKAGTTLRFMLFKLLNPNLEELQILQKYEISYQYVDPRKNNLESILDALKSMSKEDVCSIFGRCGDDVFKVIHQN